ncbi:MAG: hypothetical protein UW11_C0022G0006 [Parcubacteria group bacterium GW2011_GWA2_43_9b]|uniref:GxxExxY protein n=1 Tax=Candidatus Portnoybacteria bacterium RIFCSPLOWO2_02_FULL_39_11 TaxID=1802001 RepID=A0A1G2FQQ2_9BACT|nr:MAG: hypothetical protein UW11_C0022G0006 [Parcubacteria group bacterium GW2011_GWA2_43_9b]OGZ40419.1 MAG: hypothetical protein A3B04_02270 [Candidatus Portnoybacteria bacterium RIFCSPLOWO2_02_FULL_39_11]
MRIENSKIIYAELSYKLNGILYEAQNQLGRFCREKQYGDIIENLLKQTKILYERESALPLKDVPNKNTNKVDFIINNLILLDIKAKNFITREDYNQMKRYLKASDKKLGIIVNFREAAVRPRRIINSETKE